MATKTQAKVQQSTGKVVQVIGPVIDVEFEPERLPAPVRRVSPI